MSVRSFYRSTFVPDPRQAKSHDVDQRTKSGASQRNFYPRVCCRRRLNAPAATDPSSSRRAHPDAHLDNANSAGGRGGLLRGHDSPVPGNPCGGELGSSPRSGLAGDFRGSCQEQRPGSALIRRGLGSRQRRVRARSLRRRLRLSRSPSHTQADAGGAGMPSTLPTSVAPSRARAGRSTSSLGKANS
jgi:hypothetical protein